MRALCDDAGQFIGNGAASKGPLWVGHSSCSDSGTRIQQEGWMIIRYKKPRRRLTMVDLFAGCGGLSLGMEYAGFEPVFFSELNKDARETYLQNRRVDAAVRDPRLHIDDIRKITRVPDAMRLLCGALTEQGIDPSDLDLLVGGPPCQGFSTIGFRRTFRVAKEEIDSNHLYEDMALMIEALRPKIFLFENVKGLLTSRWQPNTRRGEVWDTIFERFKSIRGYRVAAQLVHSRDYGVPQNRPRVLLVGVRNEVKFAPTIYDWQSQANGGAVGLGFLPSAVGRAPHIEEVLGDLVEKRFSNGANIMSYPRKACGGWQKWFRSKPPAEIGGTTPSRALTHHAFSRHRESIIERFDSMRARREIPLEYQTKKFEQRRLPRKWGDGGPNITITSLPDDFVHFGKPRTLSVRECARLQTFPDWYTFSGSRTTGGRRRAGDPTVGSTERHVPQYTQVANAVPVKLAYELGRHFRSIIGAD
jgi:DNA (cytosine-5)-methyltransferase 1